MPECQKIKHGGLDQYGAERFGRLIFAMNVGMKGLKIVSLCELSLSTNGLFFVFFFI